MSPREALQLGEHDFQRVAGRAGEQAEHERRARVIAVSRVHVPVYRVHVSDTTVRSAVRRAVDQPKIRSAQQSYVSRRGQYNDPMLARAGVSDVKRLAGQRGFQLGRHVRHVIERPSVRRTSAGVCSVIHRRSVRAALAAQVQRLRGRVTTVPVRRFPSPPFVGRIRPVAVYAGRVKIVVLHVYAVVDRGTKNHSAFIPARPIKYFHAVVFAYHAFVQRVHVTVDVQQNLFGNGRVRVSYTERHRQRGERKRNARLELWYAIDSKK